MDTTLAGLVQDKPVVIFSRSTCCMSHTVKSLILSYGANPTVYELAQMPNRNQIEYALVQLGRREVVPTVFIGQKYIGGTNELMSHQVRGTLVPLLREARAIWV